MIWNPKKFIRHGLVQNVVSLYGVLACTYVLPIITFPYLARVLGPSGWGSVVFAQAIGLIIAVFVEYGFDISASRETSRHRDEPQRLAELISGVLGAKGLLALLCIAGALISRRFFHNVSPSQPLFYASVAWGVCQGINMLWFFQGLERMRLASALEIGGKLVATLSIFVLVRKPEDGWKVMAAQCMGQHRRTRRYRDSCLPRSRFCLADMVLHLQRSPFRLVNVLVSRNPGLHHISEWHGPGLSGFDGRAGRICGC